MSKSVVDVAQQAIEKILAAVAPSDASKVLANLREHKPMSRADSRIARLEASGTHGDKIAFIARAWSNAEKFGLEIDDGSGLIKGGIHAIDRVFAAAENQKHLGGNSIDARVRLKSEWRRAGIVGDGE
jgi:hypothetical protein